jgi:hypothetical protein
MVGTTRFELATSPTPRVRSTRLSHVPTIGLHVSPGGLRRGMLQCLVYTSYGVETHSLVRGSYVFLG